MFLKRLEDMLLRTEQRYSLEISDFLEPRLILLADDFMRTKGVGYFFWGGYDEAERKRLVIYPDYETEDIVLAEIAVIALNGKFDYVKVSHRDFLGAVLGLGLKREKIGDLLVSETGCYVVTTKEIAPYILNSEIRIKGVPVKGDLVENFIPPKGDIKEIGVMVASMRLDVILANGFKLSRTGAQELIAAHKVKVNHLEVTENDLLLKSGDVLSVRGKGKLKIGELNGSTKKGKLKVQLLKYGG